MALPGRGLTNAQREAYRRKLDEREVVGCELVVARYHTPTLLDLVESRHGGQLSAARAPIGMSASGQSGKRVLNQSITGFDPELPCPRAPAPGSPWGERGSYGHSMHVSGEVSIGR